MTRLSKPGVRQWRPGGSKPGRDRDPDISIRVGELRLDTKAKEESRVLRHLCRDPNPNLFSRSRSEVTPHPAKEYPGHGALGADPARLGNYVEGRQRQRTATRAERGKLGKVEC